MNCFVTGASGFIGANLVHELVARGHSVKVLLRPGADVRGLAGAEFKAVPGDIGDRPALVAAMRGCDWCFHLAANYQLWLPDYAPMFAANVDGTRNVLEAAHKAGCSRIVHTSSAGCIGLPQEHAGTLEPSDETAPVTAAQMDNPYKLSKFKAEVIAFELANKGLPIVIVNPTAPVGPREVKPTPTGQMIVDFLNRSLPAYIDTGLNWVHVRDVAAGMILAAERGRIGEKYILGHADGNWTLKQALDTLSEITGLPAPRIQLPYLMALGAAYVDETISWLSTKPPKVPLAGVRMARRKMWFSPAKAIRELGLPQTPPQRAFEEAVEWFRSKGFVRK